MLMLLTLFSAPLLIDAPLIIDDTRRHDLLIAAAIAATMPSLRCHATLPSRHAAYDAAAAIIFFFFDVITIADALTPCYAVASIRHAMLTDVTIRQRRNVILNKTHHVAHTNGIPYVTAFTFTGIQDMLCALYDGAERVSMRMQMLCSRGA